MDTLQNKIELTLKDIGEDVLFTYLKNNNKLPIEYSLITESIKWKNYMSYDNIVERAEAFARFVHNDTNHWYDRNLKLPYTYHLFQVVEVAKKFLNSSLQWSHTAEDIEIILAACWIHDLIEDGRITARDAVKVLGEKAVRAAFAVTNHKGWTRKERANAQYYEDIRSNIYSTFVKLCDRIANVEESIRTGKMLDMYRSEYPDFKKELYRPGQYEEVWSYLENLLK
jgi:(p)ppGpp synthase/HD superfamily hydrolase